MFPFFFSLAIRPLVDELAEKFALKVSLPDKDGTIHEKRLIWAYLDDISIALRPDVSHDDVIDFLSDPELQEKYGLSVNTDKSWFIDGIDLEETGHKLLGSWVGGLDNPNSGVDLLRKALDKLEFIVPVLEKMPLQHGLLLLRLCYYPILNHLLRTLPVEVGNTVIERFDTVVWKTVRRWTNDTSISSSAKAIIRLPRRLGGLGFFDSVATRPYAAAASFVQSCGLLRSKGLVLSGHLEEKLADSLSLFANDLEMGYDDLFDDSFWQSHDLQRRGVELNRERQWETVFHGLSDADKIRFLENQSVLRRKWIDCLPVMPATTLTDEEVRYGLQESLLGKFTDAIAPTKRCLECGCDDEALHHLSCSSTAHLRTTRHTAINYCVERAMKEAAAGSVLHRPFVGLAGNGESRFGDTQATIRDVRSNYDFTVVTADYRRVITLPTEAEVAEEVELDKARGTRDLERFLFWEDHSGETPHSETVSIRKSRQMMYQRTVAKDLAGADRSKYRHYGVLGIVPISFSARGALGRHTVQLVDNLCKNRSDWEFSDAVKYRNDLLSRLSVIMLRAAHCMKVVRSARALDGY